MLRIGHVNLSAAETTADSVLLTIRNMQADVLSIQEITPNWNPMLDSLNATFPYKCVYRGVDLYSFGLFSKHPIQHCDTIFCQRVPNLLVHIQPKSVRQSLYVLETYMAPPIFAGAYEQMRQQLDSITQQVRRIDQPLITVGNFNLEAANFEIQQFRRSANLSDSRRGFRPLRNDGRVPFFDVPYDHIFYSNQLECIDFQTIGGKSSERLGIMGLYQFVPTKATLNRLPTSLH
jgi:endonuclease/exonuclease/phosphatase (EEP) superfamily protein YafD